MFQNQFADSLGKSLVGRFLKQSPLTPNDISLFIQQDQISEILRFDSKTLLPGIGTTVNGDHVVVIAFRSPTTHTAIVAPRGLLRTSSFF